MAQWKIHQVSYINDRLYAEGEIAELGRRGIDRVTKKPIHHLPGPHWEPVDDEAKEIAKGCGHVFTGEVPDMVLSMTADLEKTMKSGSGGPGGTIVIDHEALGATIANGIAQGLAKLQGDGKADALTAREAELAEREKAHAAAVAAFEAAQAETKGKTA